MFGLSEGFQSQHFFNTVRRSSDMSKAKVSAGQTLSTINFAHAMSLVSPYGFLLVRTCVKFRQDKSNGGLNAVPTLRARHPQAHISLAKSDSASSRSSGLKVRTVWGCLVIVVYVPSGASILAKLKSQRTARGPTSTATLS